MIAIIDYGVGNIFSLCSAFNSIGQEAKLTGNPEEIEDADKIILPGVGAFGDAIKKLHESGLVDTVLSKVDEGTPLLGICLGMQLLFEKGYEYGEHEGLGLIKGSVVTMEGLVPSHYKIPHIGWNKLVFPKDKERNPIFQYIKEGDFVYFVHSYYGSNCEDSLIASTEYGAPLTAAVAKDNVYGVQFHPEKSGEVGMNILRGFCEVQR